MLGQTFGRASTGINPPGRWWSISLEVLQKRKDKHLSGMSKQILPRGKGMGWQMNSEVPSSSIFVLFWEMLIHT